jgi:hypothetical protein
MPVTREESALEIATDSRRTATAGWIAQPAECWIALLT